MNGRAGAARVFVPMSKIPRRPFSIRSRATPPVIFADLWPRGHTRARGTIRAVQVAGGGRDGDRRRREREDHRAAERSCAGRRPRSGSRRRARPGRAPRRAAGGPEVHRPAGDLAAHGDGARDARRGGVQRRDRLRRLVDPRVPGDLRVGHAADARPVDRDPRPVLRGADDLARVHGARPDHARALHARPALRGDQGRGAPALERRRRRRLLRPRGGVLRVRPRRLRPAGEHGVLRGRLRGGATGPPARASSAAARGCPRSATRTARRRATSRRRRTTP